MRNNKGQFVKGSNEWLGKHHSQETRKKLSDAHKGMTISEETRQKMRIANKNPNSGQFKKGNVPPQAGTGKPKEGDSICPVCKKTFHWVCKFSISKFGYKNYQPAPKTCRDKKCQYESVAIAQRGKGRPHMRGENAYQWRGGQGSLRKAINGCLLYDILRKDCFKRDKWHCQICLKHEHILNMDHIIPVAFIIHKYKITSIQEAEECKELWDLGNVRTVCVPCHKKTETYSMALTKQLLKY